MSIEQTVEIPSFPASEGKRRLTIDVPPEVPAGRVVLTFTPAERNTTQDSWRSLYGICKNSGDTLAAFLERKHAGRERENAAMERRLRERESRE